MDENTANDQAETQPEEPSTPDREMSEYLGMGTLIGFGAMFGMVFGLMLGNMLWGMLVGAAAGTVIGAIVEAQRKK